MSHRKSGTYSKPSRISDICTYKFFQKSLIKNQSNFRRFKLQSAMEYLMTYGWAILIIAIVMIAMFSLGIFNPSEPRVSAGACEVYHGNDVGECQGVWPQFVAKFDNPIGAPSGESTSNIIVANDPLLTAQNPPPFTVTLWYNINGAPTGSSTQYWDNLVSIPGYTGIEFINQGSNQASIFLQGHH